jgi:hypothetical protein
MNANQIADFDLNETTVGDLGFTAKLTHQLTNIITNYPRISWTVELTIKEMMLSGAKKATVARKVREMISH